MKKLTLLIATIILISCNSSPIPDCLVYDTVRINVDVPFPVFDSLAAFKIDSMTQVYYDDIEKKRSHFIAWRDSTENALIILSNLERDKLLSLTKRTYFVIDSLKRSMKFDYNFYCKDGSHYRVYYDTIILKPIADFN